MLVTLKISIDIFLSIMDSAMCFPTPRHQVVHRSGSRVAVPHELQEAAELPKPTSQPHLELTKVLFRWVYSYSTFPL